MAPLVVAGVLAVELAVSVPRRPAPRVEVTIERPARRNVFARFGRAVRRVAAIEPAAAMRFSSWGIPDPGKRQVEANVTGAPRGAFKQQ
jgi:hypothetical protein